MNMQKCKCIEESFSHPQREERLQQRQGASGATSLPTSQAGRASLSMNSRVPASFVQEPNNPSQVHKLWCTEQEQCAVLAAGRVLLQWQTWRSSQLLHSRLQCHYSLPPCHNSGWCSQPECLASGKQMSSLAALPSILAAQIFLPKAVFAAVGLGAPYS